MRGPETKRRSFLVALAGAPFLRLPKALAQEASPAPDAHVAQALCDYVRLRFGSQLPPEDLQEIAKSIAENLTLVESLRKLKLGNGDDPVTTFKPRTPRARR
jgi:hypothetical protein